MSLTIVQFQSATTESESDRVAAATAFAVVAAGAYRHAAPSPQDFARAVACLATNSAHDHPYREIATGIRESIDDLDDDDAQLTMLDHAEDGFNGIWFEPGVQERISGLGHNWSDDPDAVADVQAHASEELRLVGASIRVLAGHDEWWAFAVADALDTLPNE